MGYVQSDGAQLYYEVAGEGEPLVLLHGNGEDMSYFSHQIPEFSKHWKVITIDTRAHGRSSRGSGKLNFQQFSRDLRAVLDALSLERVHLLGFSDGANTAIQFAMDYPQRLRSLILNGGDMHPSGVARRVQIPIILGWAVLCAIAAFDKKAVVKKEVMELMVRHPNFTAAQLEQIRVPTLVIAGEHDMILRAHTEKIAAAISGSKLVFLPGADHFAAAKHPEAFNREIVSFLEYVSSPAARTRGLQDCLDD